MMKRKLENRLEQLSINLNREVAPGFCFVAFSDDEPVPTSSENARAQRRQKGVTLIELLVVLAILALISAIVVINILPERDRAAVRKAEIDIRTIETAIDQYRLDMFSYPSTQQGLEALVTVPDDVARKSDYRPGGYLRGGAPLDPWGNPYQYRFPGENGVVDIYSFGADGEPGGEGLDADIGNWSDDNR